MGDEGSSELLHPNEVRDRIAALPQAELLRLQKIAAARCKFGPMEPSELLQEAFARSLDGDRRCPRGVDIVQFLAGAMHSIASDEAKAHRREGEAVMTKALPLAQAEANESLPFEQRVISAETARRVRGAVLELFKDDIVASTVLEGGMDDMSAEEVRELTGLDLVAYASVRRKIRRRIDKAFPSGRPQ